MRKLPATLALTTAALALTSVLLWRDRNIARARAEVLQARLMVLEQSHAATSATQSTTPEHSSVSSDIAAEAAASKLAAGQPRPSAVTTSRDWSASERRLLLDPKYRAARAANRRSGFASTRRELIGVVRLSPAQADGLVDYWVESELRYLEQPHPNPTNEDEMRVRVQEIEAANLKKEKDLRAMLGDTAYASLQRFEASRQSRNVVNELRDTLTDGEALQDYQIEPLVDALHAEQSQLKAEMREFSAALTAENSDGAKSRRRLQQHASERTLAANQRIHAAAATILSSQQVDALDSVLQRRLVADQARETIFRTEAESAVAGNKAGKTN